MLFNSIVKQNMFDVKIWIYKSSDFANNFQISFLTEQFREVNALELDWTSTGRRYELRAAT